VAAVSQGDSVIAPIPDSYNGLIAAWDSIEISNLDDMRTEALGDICRMLMPPAESPESTDRHRESMDDLAAFLIRRTADLEVTDEERYVHSRS